MLLQAEAALCWEDFVPHCRGLRVQKVLAFSRAPVFVGAHAPFGRSACCGTILIFVDAQEEGVAGPGRLSGRMSALSNRSNSLAKGDYSDGDAYSLQGGCGLFPGSVSPHCNLRAAFWQPGNCSMTTHI